MIFKREKSYAFMPNKGLNIFNEDTHKSLDMKIKNVLTAVDFIVSSFTVFISVANLMSINAS